LLRRALLRHRHTGPKEVLEQHAELRRQLEAAEASLRGKLAEETSLSTQLEQARARLGNVAAEEAGLRHRVEALQRQKVSDFAGAAGRGRHDELCEQQMGQHVWHLRCKGGATC
jgi:chromosome segregation ATPase